MKRVVFLFFTLLIFLGCEARVYLVSVGIGDYTAYPSPVMNLKKTVPDAKTIANLYSTNTSVDYALLLDSKATKSRILKAIKKVFNMAKEDDIVVFYFSGHGYPGGFCAYDGRLSYDNIRKAMAKSKSKNKMIFADACHSGGMRITPQKTNNQINAAKNANVMLFLASRNSENSQELAIMDNGLFTAYLKEGLSGRADANKDKIITAKELFNYVYPIVKNLSNNEQHPVMWGKFNDNMPVMIWK